jgi:hypothetical protein
VLDRVGDAAREPPVLLRLTDVEEILQQDDAVVDHLALDRGGQPEKVFVFVVAAEPHDPLDPRPVVPGPVEQDDLTRRGEMGDVALDVELAPFPIRWLRQRDVLEHAGAAALHDAADDATLAGRVPPLEHDDHPRALGHRPRLQPGELDLKPCELFLELFTRHLLRGVATVSR